MRLSAGVLTAQLAQAGSLWSLKNGVIAARWSLADVFKSLSSYRDNKGQPICTTSGYSYTVAKGTICSDADILVDGTQPKSAPCDALSIGLGFTADPAVIGAVSDASAPPTAARRTPTPPTTPADPGSPRQIAGMMSGAHYAARR